MKQRIAGTAPIIIVRPFNTFGPYQSTKAIIPELILNCLMGRPVRTTGGEQTREFNFVSNIVDGLILAGQYAEKVEGPINLASGVEVPIRDVVKKIAALTATQSHVEIGALPYRPTEIWRMFADRQRAESILKWQPKVSLDEGLKLTVDWFREYVREAHLAHA
jgi:UDP-glucose 4-epimerase